MERIRLATNKTLGITIHYYLDVCILSSPPESFRLQTDKKITLLHKPGIR
jgi:hypothetical protein